MQPTLAHVAGPDEARHRYDSSPAHRILPRDEAGETNEPSRAEARLTRPPTPHEERIRGIPRGRVMSTVSTGRLQRDGSSRQVIGPAHYLRRHVRWPATSLLRDGTYHVRCPGSFIEQCWGSCWAVRPMWIWPRSRCRAHRGTPAGAPKGEADLAKAWSDLRRAARDAMNSPAATSAAHAASSSMGAPRRGSSSRFAAAGSERRKRNHRRDTAPVQEHRTGGGRNDARRGRSGGEELR